MKKRLFLCSLTISGFLLLLFGLGCLLYVFGEPSSIPLGSEESEIIESINTAMRYGRVIEVDEVSDLELFYQGELHHIHILPIGERLAKALLLALQGDYGYSLSNNAGVGDIVFPSLVKSGLYLLILLPFVLLGSLLHKPMNHKAMLILSLGFLLTAHGLSFVPAMWAYYASVLSTGIALCFFGLYLPSKQRWIHKVPYLYFIGLIQMALCGLYRPYTGYGIESSFWYGVISGDSHLYPVAMFFLFAPLGIVLILALFTRPNKANKPAM